MALLRQPPVVARRTAVHHGNAFTGQAPKTIGGTLLPRPGCGPRGAPSRRVVAQALQRSLCEDRRRRGGEPRKHPSRGRFHNLRTQRSSSLQPHSRSVLRPGQALPGIRPSRFPHVMGLDRSRYLVRLAKKRAQGEGLHGGCSRRAMRATRAWPRTASIALPSWAIRLVISPTSRTTRS